jgi:hypothetical protein
MRYLVQISDNRTDFKTLSAFDKLDKAQKDLTDRVLMADYKSFRIIDTESRDLLIINYYERKVNDN